MIGVSNAGYKAHQMNAVLNVKTAEKRLQFGIKKCKSMLISKNPENALNSNLMVDKWDVKHVYNPDTDSYEICETYQGLVPIDKTDKQKYLGFVLSSKGDNMVNITEMKNKSIWVIRKIFLRLDGLHLKKYYFECGILFLHVMLRSTILYGCESYYNLKEAEVRQLEMIEEGFLRKLFKTSRGCPLAQLYLESGLIPARFQIKHTKLLFLKYILNEKPDSLLHRFLNIQIENPTKGDWATSCWKDLKELKIELSIEEIKQISSSSFVKILKHSIKNSAFEYLIGKRGSKGHEISYSELKMSEYLMPNVQNVTIEQKRNIFEIINRMAKIPANFPNKQKNKKYFCPCEQIENMEQIYNCKYWNIEEATTEYGKIFGDDIDEQIKVNKRFQHNLEKREEFINEEKEGEVKSHVILSVDPLSSLFEHSIGNK
jgi:hypothetical protein